MSRTGCYVVALLYALSGNILASQVSGKITIEKRVAKKSVAIAVYDLRGMAVPDGVSAGQNSNEFDRIAVWLDSAVASAASPITATMQQQNRRFEPDLLVIPVGSTVNFPNLDPIFHNIFSLSRTQSFDLGYYSEGRSRSVRFTRAGIVQVYCHVHPNMHGVIVVNSSRWSGKPREDGTFSWTGVPAGKYRLGIWQKSLGLLHRTVVFPEAGSVHVTVSLPEEDPED
jgi:plastocyanin